MILEIIDVEHGACAFIRTSNGKKVMIDCGHNGPLGWRPGDALVNAGHYELDRLFITNYDEDHVSGYPNLMDRVSVKVLTRNWQVSPQVIRHLKTEDGMGPGIDRLVNTIEHYFTGGAPAANDLYYGDTAFEVFANPYGSPPRGFIDENNLSLVVFVTCGVHRIIFPGDLEKAGWEMMLQNEQFRQMLSGVTIFVASHHGRENGYCEEIFDICKNVQAVVISDKAKQYQTQETVPVYRGHASGFNYNGELRRVLTTRRDGSITFNFTGQGAFVELQRTGT